jgi:hypothetical protein
MRAMATEPTWDRCFKQPVTHEGKCRSASLSNVGVRLMQVEHLLTVRSVRPLAPSSPGWYGTDDRHRPIVEGQHQDAEGVFHLPIRNAVVGNAVHGGAQNS